MSRNASGTMSVINTFVSGTPIAASGHNENFQDIADELTNSVAADGQTSMTGALKASNGTAAAPALTFASSTSRGIYKTTNGIGFSVGGSFICEITGVSPFTHIGEIKMWPALVAPTGYLACNGQSLLRATYPDLFNVIGTYYGAADGTHFALPNMQCTIPVHLDTSSRHLYAGTDILGVTVGDQIKDNTKTSTPPAYQPVFVLNFIIFTGVV